MYYPSLLSKAILATLFRDYVFRFKINLLTNGYIEITPYMYI